jgi:hypothetical protein
MNETRYENDIEQKENSSTDRDADDDNQGNLSTPLQSLLQHVLLSSRQRRLTYFFLFFILFIYFCGTAKKIVSQDKK